MTERFWRKDSIARRFILTVASVVVCTFGLVALFLSFGGIWAAPPIEKTGLLERAVEFYRMINAAPPSVRPLLAAATSDRFRVVWLSADSPASRTLTSVARIMPPIRDDGEVARVVQEQLGSASTVLIIRPDTPAGAINPSLGPEPEFHAQRPAMGLALPDGSWLVYTADHRLWGLPSPVRWTIWGIFLVTATGVVSLIATRRLVRPIRQFADAIRLFGTNPQAPPMPEVGPVEFRSVIAAFNTMQGQIQRLMTYRTAMLAAISHDLRTPLTRIRLRGEFIRDPVQQTRLFRDVDDLQQMIDGALAFFRGDAHEESMTPLDLPSILQTVVGDFSDQGVIVGYRGPARLLYLGRPVALKRAITNLVENAVKYGTPPDIRLSVEPPQVLITVTDRGPGIPEESLERVFQPFHRLEKSRNRATGGVGLGLTATQSIIREHGGEVALANRPGGGLEARITLPDTASAALSFSDATNR